MNTKLKLHELNRIDIDTFKKVKKTPIWIVLDNIRSLQNIGSIFRTADAFRIEKVILCGITASPPHREITKSALGATESVEWIYLKTADMVIEHCKNYDVKILPVEQTAESKLLTEIDFNLDKMALVFGNEVEGVTDEFIRAASYCIEIQQFGTKHSFNVSISAAIVLWDYFLKRGKNLIS